MSTNDEPVTYTELYTIAYEALGAVDTSSAQSAVVGLTDALAAVEAARDEAMAQAVVEGVSVRQVAAAAGMAQNSVTPRLARSATLGSYAEGSRVTSQGIARARYEAESAPEPNRFTFTRRTPTKEN